MRRFAWVYSAVLALFTVYLALDTFVIARVYAPTLPVETTESISAETTAAPVEASYTLSEHRTHDTTVYVVTLTLSEPGQLRTVLARNAYGRNLTEATSSMAARVGAAVAINGDYYGSRERGYVIRNGELLRDSSAGGEDLVIWGDGSFSIINEREVTADELLAQGAEQVFCFGPALVVDGEIAVEPGEEVGKAMVSNPRTAIGIDAAGTLYLVVSDGRTRQSAGLSLRELAEFMQELGCSVAYNLDGGGSSTLVVDGRVVNNPTTNGRNVSERSVSDCVCFIP